MNVREVFLFLYIEVYSLKQNFLNIVKDFSAYEVNQNAEYGTVPETSSEYREPGARCVALIDVR